MTPHVLAAVLLLQSAAARPVDGFYLGTLTSEARTLEVGVTLKTDGSGITGTCFYFGPSDDTIALKGAMGAGQTIRLSETTSDGKVTGRWAGRIVGDGLAGTWTNARNGKQWAFQLTRADQASPYFDGPARTMDTASGPVAFRMARVPASDHRVPLMTSFRNPQVTNAVNETLMTVANAARCEDEKNDDFELEADVSFVGEDLLSVRIIESWFCDAAYPTSGADRSVVFDLRNGAAVTFDELFRKDLAPGQLGAVLFPYELSRTRSRASPSGTPAQDGDCLDVWSQELAAANLSVSFHVTDDGLVVRMDLPHVVEVCANDVTVPFAAMASIAAPGGPLARLAAARRDKPSVYRIHRRGTTADQDLSYTPPAR